MIKYSILVTGLEPAPYGAVNKLLKALDLGLEGAYVEFGHRLTMTFEQEMQPADWARIEQATKLAYEHIGCTQINVQLEG